jgi:hypothetical protein
MDRRTFLTQAGVLAALSGVAIRVTGCSDDGGGGGMGAGTPDVNGTVTGGGHSHSVALSGATIDSPTDVTLTLTGSGHTHRVMLTEDEVMRIGNGETVSKDIIPDGSHDHTVRFN